MTMAVDLSQMTEAQKAALREQLNAEAKSSRQENRKAYEDLRHEFMVNVENQLGIIVKSVKQFKDWLGSESDAFTKIMQRYGQTKFDDQKSFTITDGDFRRGCMAREFEPDEPNFTPRISAVVNADGSFEISILKHQENGRCLREFFCYEGANEGRGYFISTYQGDGNPLPTFAGEPVEVSLPAPEEVWAALDADNKVSLYANVAGKVTLFNKNLGD